MKQIIIVLICLLFLFGCEYDKCAGQSLEEGLIDCIDYSESYRECYHCCTGLKGDGIFGCDTWTDNYCLEMCNH